MRSSKHKDKDLYSEESGKSSKRSKLERSSFRPSKTLCVSQFPSRLSEDDIKNMLHKEFRKFGDHSITVSRGSKGAKVAYVQFRYSEDAHAARSAHKNKSLNFDPMICIETADDIAGSKSSSPYINSRVSDHCLPSPELSGQSKSRSEKFHPDDMEDKAATRTLFIGNLDHEITESELGEIFGRFGFIEDIDIKRGSQTHGSVYAFIRFHNLEMARRAKKEMSGQYIRKYQCRIGYGKHVPSNCLWVGSLGPWLTKEDLERCFGSFNPLRIEWSSGRSHAYLVFSSLEVATSVLNSMQGFEICPGHCIRLDYSDESHIAALMNTSRDDKSGAKLATDASTESKAQKSTYAIVNAVPSGLKSVLSETQNTCHLVKHCQVVWKGNLTLKNASFAARMLLISGSPKLLDILLAQHSQVKFSHEISLNHKKVTSFFEGITGNLFDCALLLICPDNEESQKHFQMVNTYIRQKHICTISLLPPGSALDKSIGVLHLFPMSPQVRQLLQILCPKIVELPTKELLFATMNTISVG